MKHTRIKRWLAEPPEHIKCLAEQALGHTGYTWTGFSGAQFDLQIVWCFELYNVEDSRLTMIDTILSEYYVGGIQ